MKQKPINLILRDDKGNLHRIFKILHQKDNYGESYFKLMFPDLKGKKIGTTNVPVYIAPPDLKAFFEKMEEVAVEEFHEFTYHYESGVAHFKNDRGDHIHQIRNLPKLQENKFLNFMRFVIHDLAEFKIYKKKLGDNCIVLKLPLNNLGRLINLYLLDDINIRIENDNPEVALIDDYKINIMGTNKYLIIQEFCYADPSLKDQRISFSLFMFNDTSVELVEGEVGV